MLVDPGTHVISGGEATLAFDRDVLEAVSVESGSFLGSQPLIELKQIENPNGRATLALAKVGPTVGPLFEGTFGVFRLRVKPAATPGQHEIRLELGLADQHFDSLAVNALGALVTVR